MSYVILWLLWEKVSLCLCLSLSLSLSLFSHLHRRLICLAISDGVMLTVCCSFPLVVVTLTALERKRERASERAKGREIDLRSAMREGEKKKKYYRNGQSHHLSHVCMCRLTCESISFCANIHTQTNRTNQQPKKMLSQRTRVCNKKKRTRDRNCVILAFLSLSFVRSLSFSLLGEQTLSKYFEYSCKDLSLSLSLSLSIARLRLQFFFDPNHRKIKQTFSISASCTKKKNKKKKSNVYV